MPMTSPAAAAAAAAAAMPSTPAGASTHITCVSTNADDPGSRRLVVLPIFPLCARSRSRASRATAAAAPASAAAAACCAVARALTMSCILSLCAWVLDEWRVGRKVVRLGRIWVGLEVGERGV